MSHDHVNLRWQFQQSQLLLLTESYVTTESCDHRLQPSDDFPTDFSWQKLTMKVANGDHMATECYHDCSHKDPS